MRSPYGWHLVLLTERRPARLPDLEEIEDRVREDRERIRVAAARRTTIDRIVEGYEVTLVGPDLEALAEEVRR
jgi:parvulin-like peptidyl-prolyl isomerase